MKDCGYKREMMGEMGEETRYPQFSLIGDPAADFPKEGEHDIKVRVRVVGTRTPYEGKPAVDLEVLKIGDASSAKPETEDDEDGDESPLVASMKKMRKEMD